MNLRRITGHEELPNHTCDGSQVCEYGLTGLRAVKHGTSAIAEWVSSNPGVSIPDVVYGTFLQGHPELFVMHWEVPEVSDH